MAHFFIGLWVVFVIIWLIGMFFGYDRVLEVSFLEQQELNDTFHTIWIGGHDT